MNEELSDYLLFIQLVYNSTGSINLDPFVESRFLTPLLVNIELNCTESSNRICVNESELLVTIDV